MIDYITGKPRTGKSYRAMKYILDNFFDENKTPPYRYILTNIGGFQFDYLNKKFDAMGRDNKALQILWKGFLAHITTMHKMALDDKTDEELIRYADYHKINNALIVIDEAMLYMKKLDDSMSWFFSYHGHFKVRMIVMCQHPKQVHADYKIHTEFFIHAQDQSKQLTDSTLKYKHYDNPELKDSHHSDSIKTDPEVYKLYKSGEIDKPKKILYKYLIMGVFVILFLLGVLYALFSRLAPSSTSNDLDNNKTEISKNDKKINDEKGILLAVRCNEKFCWNSDKMYEDNQITITYFKFLVLKYELELQYTEIKNEIYRLVPTEKGYSKVSLASLSDYYYKIPPDLKETYLASFFIPRKIENEPISIMSNEFNTTTN
ncbi:MAG: hypothetical protein NTZ60_02630 [Campylobacterales bacterium]|nr:hypothetical protein [Campylobacterales bacterium]